MGQSKALMDLDGQSALERIARLKNCDGSSLDTVVICGHNSEAVIAESDRLTLSSVVNSDWESGQTASLQCGLRQIPREAEAVLLHPVDLPLIRQSDYDACLSAWRADQGRHDLATSSFDHRRGHPLIISRTCIQRFLDLNPGDSARSVTRDENLRMLYVEVTNPWVLKDLDTPADLAEAIQFLQT